MKRYIDISEIITTNKQRREYMWAFLRCHCGCFLFESKIVLLFYIKIVFLKNCRICKNENIFTKKSNRNHTCIYIYILIIHNIYNQQNKTKTNTRYEMHMWVRLMKNIIWNHFFLRFLKIKQLDFMKNSKICLKDSF